MYSPNAIRAEMARKRVTLSDLSEKTGLGVSSLCKIVGENGNPQVRNLEKIARALNVPVAIFFVDDLPDSVKTS